MKQADAHPTSLRQTLLHGGRQHATQFMLAGGVLIVLLGGWFFLTEQPPALLDNPQPLWGAVWRAHQQVGVLGLQLEQAILPGATPVNKGDESSVAIEVRALQSKVAQLEAENQNLRTQLDLPLTNQTETIRVPIISLDQKLLEYPKTFTPKVGQLVVRDGVLLGRVVEVVGQRARVDLLAEKSFPNLVVQTSRGTSGMLVSQNGSSILTQVPSQLPLVQDDVVLTSDQLLAPSGLVIGTLRGVQLDDTGSVQTAN